MADSESVPVPYDPSPHSKQEEESTVRDDEVVSNGQMRTPLAETENGECADVPPPKVIEVERKFVVTDDCKEKLLELGAELLQMSEFTDKYFDVKQFTLSTRDFWLRTRDGKFELKYPVVKKDLNTPSTQYHELDDEAAILEKIAEVMERDPGAMSLPEFLAEAKCSAFSCYTTRRLSYSLEDFMIVLDEMDFGFSIGEIERMVVSEARIADALVAIDKMAEKLGLKGRQKVPGKMDAYLKRKRPKHYQALLDAKVMFESKT